MSQVTPEFNSVPAGTGEGNLDTTLDIQKQMSWKDKAAMKKQAELQALQAAEEAARASSSGSCTCFHKIQQEDWAIKANKFLSSNMGWSVLVLFLTIWALYMDDIQYLFISKDADNAMFGIAWFIFLIFFFEVMVSAVVERGYLFSLVMVMDLLAAVSLIPFTSLVEQGSLGSGGDETMDEAAVARIARTFRALRILRATRAAAMTLKTTTVMKRAADDVAARKRELANRRKSAGNVLRLKEKMQQLEEKTGGSVGRNRSASVASSESMEELRQELKAEKAKIESGGATRSVLEETLLVRTNAKMLLGVLVLLMGTTLMDNPEIDQTAITGLNIVNEAVIEMKAAANDFGPINLDQIDGLADKYKKSVERTSTNLQTGREVLKLTIDGHKIGANKDIAPYRRVELQSILVKNTTTTGTTEAIINLKPLRDIDSGLSIAVTTFSVIVIVVWAESFRADHRNFVIVPVSRMIKHLKHMAEDPRLALGADALVQGRNNRRKLSGKDGAPASEMETIESCVARFGKLLQVGFGEAGMGIIASNMGSGGVFDPVVEGKKIFAIFGFCDIRNFTDCCEVLEEETMIFTNQIAKVVHSLVHTSKGSVNKNIGDAFLTVWKVSIPEKDKSKFSGLPQPESKDSSGRKVNPHTRENSAIADGALNAFVKTRHLLETDQYIQELGRDERLQKKLPGYSVRMGYGLHFGWAIEGAVGSKYKVDATYLSPHVNMSARLESTSKQYGVQMLLSGPFYDALGDSMKEQCRPLDCVTVKGSNVPVMLYGHQLSEFKAKTGKDGKILTSQQKDKFDKTWATAFAHYKKGDDWPKAQSLMKECLEISPGDPPTLLLLDVMQGGDSPADWDGFRELTSK